MKKWQIPFLLLLIAGTAFIIRRHNAPSVVPFQAEEGYIFGTIYHAKYQYATSLHEEILQELNTVDASLSMFNPQSCISRINRGEDIPADSLITTLFRQASAISEATDGAFDITVAPLVNAWGFGIKHDALPDSATVDSLRALVGWQRVRLQDGRLQRDDSRMIFDFSAIAKGFGADCVAQLFERRGIHNYMIEIGGEIVVGGQKSATEQWRVGITKPSDEGADGELQEVVEMKAGTAMATSGNYRNFYVRNGRKYAHTINPHTGRPVEHTLLSATVVAPNCALADAYATAFMSMGLDEAKKLLAQHPELKAYLIYSGSRGEYLTYSTIEK